MKLFLFLCFILYINNVNSAKRYYLNDQWKVHNENRSISIPVTVPGGIYSDLMNSGILHDIYYRFNDVDYRWVANEIWIYETHFIANKVNVNTTNINLVFNGLDTFAVIYLNDHIIGKSDNMFVRYAFDITPYLQSSNNLTIKFLSPLKVADVLYMNQAKNYIVPPKCVPKEYNGECHVNFIRKMQASFSWDWGPAFPSIGIWKPVYIQNFTKPILQDVTLRMEDSDSEDKWLITLTLYIECPNKKVTGTIRTEIQTNIETIINFYKVNGTTQNGEYSQQVLIKIPKVYVNLWWPNGYGTQSLYDLKVIYTSNDVEFSIKQLRIGFRTIKLIQKPTGKSLTFYFEVNNIPLFMKGSNWIPANILPEKSYNKTDILFLLQSAKDVHMNMLRVWGGGVYESDFFYDTADELGILIWQDFMFACSMYPVDDAFLKSVNLEVKQQVRRLQHHPSIAVWAGNNENEAALRDDWYGTSTNFAQYKKDYVKLYVNNIRATCIKNDPTRTFLVSSPSNGLQSEKDGYVAKNPYDVHFGDIHYYNYILDSWNQNYYKKPRFSSEYGFQSLPSLETLSSATNITDDLDLESMFLFKRQHHAAGYLEIELLIHKQMILPKTTGKKFLNTFIYYSQISQAMAVKVQTEHYRQWRNSVDSNGAGLTMGALYWQLNDVWQCPSWSSIDFKKKWKMLHYFARKFFHPVLLTANINPANQMTVYVVSDLTTFIYNATIELSVYNWNNFVPVYVDRLATINVLPGFSNVVYQLGVYEYLENVGCGKPLIGKLRCFFILNLIGKNGDKLTSSNFLFPAPLKNVLNLSTPQLSVTVSSNSVGKKTNNFNVTVTTNRIAPFVWLETPGLNGLFSNNGFLQIKKTKEINYTIPMPITVNQLQNAIKITSLKSREHL